MLGAIGLAVLALTGCDHFVHEQVEVTVSPATQAAHADDFPVVLVVHDVVDGLAAETPRLAKVLCAPSDEPVEELAIDDRLGGCSHPDRIVARLDAWRDAEACVEQDVTEVWDVVASNVLPIDDAPSAAATPACDDGFVVQLRL
jgi:hypothetical protein